MLKSQVEEGLVLLAKTTPGKWKVRELRPFGADGSRDEFFVQAPRIKLDDPYDIEVLGDDISLYPTKRGDADFIVWARNNAEFLINAAAAYAGTMEQKINGQ